MKYNLRFMVCRLRVIVSMLSTSLRFCVKIFCFLVIPFASYSQLLFTRITPEESGVKFVNAIIESQKINFFSYGYLYNGGGVAVGDVNNDGLADLYFSGNMVHNILYLNQGNLKFKDVTDSAGVDGGLGFKTGVSMVDINGDGLLDIYVCKSAVSEPSLRKNMLYINNGNMTFTDKAKEYGVDDESYTTQGYFYDMDLDGDLDLFLLNHPDEMNYSSKIELTYDKTGNLIALRDTQRTYISNRYYENINGHFKDKTFSAGLGTYAFGLSAIIDDFNGDGYPDIYACNDFHYPDYLFINNKNGTFTNRLDEHFQHTSNSSMGSDYADINNDGFLDLMVLDMLPESFQKQKQLKPPVNYDTFYKRIKYGYGTQFVKNVLQLNNGNNTYSDISYLANVAFTDWSWAPLIADFDNDGFKDIYVTNGYLRDVTDLDFIVYNNDSIVKHLIKEEGKLDTLKLLSAIPSNKVFNYFFRNNGNLTFNSISATCGLNTPSFGNGAAYADLDNDGDLDLIVNNIDEEPFIYRNNSVQNKAGNYIRFKLKGTDKNIEGIGTAIQIETPDGTKQVQHFMPDKGYISSHERFVHFGIGQNKFANVIITWPNGLMQTISALEANHVYTLDIKNAFAKPKAEEKISTLFIDITKETNVIYKQKENTYIDFKLEPLLPHQFSQLGPCIAVADVDGNGTEDFFIGGSKDNEAFVYMQDHAGKFSKSKQPGITADKQLEDTGSEFFDADNDGDKDLLVVSGGNEYPETDSMYPVRLYLNDGKGNFIKDKNFPVIYSSAKAIAIDDYDKDGDADIFIGGRVVPGHYGLIPQSFLLQNNKGNFTDITKQIPSLASIGMVTDAIWCDINKDSWKDLIMVGEWMPLTIYKNNPAASGSKLDAPIINENSYGWWNTIAQTDVDNDGDIDLIGGNVSINTRYRGNEQYPVTMVVSDFDNNGSTDCVISLYQEGKSYPLATRDNLLDQMNFLKKKFLRYHDYANATINDVFTPEQLSKAQTFKANNIANVVFNNDGAGNFSQQLLSSKAQIFPINAIITDDFDKDGLTDLLVAGNDYSTEVETGRNDGGIGLFLKNFGAGKFRGVTVTQSGFYAPGDVKCIKRIKINNKPCFIIGKNQGDLQFVRYNEIK